MATLKDAKERAYRLGYDAGLLTPYCSKVVNPYTRKLLAGEWRKGFIAGRDEKERIGKEQGKVLDPPKGIGI